MSSDKSKRTFSDIRSNILISLSEGQKTINQLANDAGINWKTVSNHLIHLLGKGFVNEVLSTPYVRVFELSEHGKEHLNSTSKKKIRFETNKIPIKVQVI